MMMAFYMDQIQQHSCPLFKELLNDLKTKSKLWESIRAVFKILPRKNMTELFFSIAEMYQIRACLKLTFGDKNSHLFD